MASLDFFNKKEIVGIGASSYNEKLIDVWKDSINGDEKSWVLFENGTCVILLEPEEDLAKQAKELLGKTMLGHQDLYKYIEDNSLAEKLK